MTSKLNIRNIIFEMDSLIAVNMVTSGSSQNSFLHLFSMRRALLSTSLDGELQSVMCIARLTNVLIC